MSLKLILPFSVLGLGSAATASAGIYSHASGSDAGKELGAAGPGAQATPTNVQLQNPSETAEGDEESAQTTGKNDVDTPSNNPSENAQDRKEESSGIPKARGEDSSNKTQDSTDPSKGNQEGNSLDQTGTNPTVPPAKEPAGDKSESTDQSNGVGGSGSPVKTVQESGNAQPQNADNSEPKTQGEGSEGSKASVTGVGEGSKGNNGSGSEDGMNSAGGTGDGASNPGSDLSQESK